MLPRSRPRFDRATSLPRPRPHGIQRDPTPHPSHRPDSVPLHLRHRLVTIGMTTAELSRAGRLRGGPLHLRNPHLPRNITELTQRRRPTQSGYDPCAGG